MIKVNKADYLAICKAWETISAGFDTLIEVTKKADPNADIKLLGKAWDYFLGYSPAVPETSPILSFAIDYGKRYKQRHLDHRNIEIVD